MSSMTSASRSALLVLAMSALCPIVTSCGRAAPNADATTNGPLYYATPEWRRICPGMTADTRWSPAPTAQSAGIWTAETPFLMEKRSADNQWVLGERSFDGRKSWIPIKNVCNLDNRRRVCGAAQTTLFWYDSQDSASGRLIYEGTQVTVNEFSSRGFAKIDYNGTKFWMWNDYLCPVDPNVPSSGPGGSIPKNTPKGAFLSMLAYAEGTNDSYNVIFGFETFSSYAEHPRRVVCSYGLCSDAAGRYQMLSTTWDGARAALGLPDFSPGSQDQAGLYLMRNRGVANADRRLNWDEFSAAVYKLNAEWASLPGSPYGQPTKSMKDLWDKYNSYF